MNKKLGLAVAGALLAASASAQAGITIPAGDWTIDVGGNVNAYYTNTKFSGSLKTAGVENRAQVIQTGLLPSALGIGGKTRQNDLDIAFQFTFFTGVDAGNATAAMEDSNGDTIAATSNRAGGSNTLNIRQAFMTFGDASWGSVKAGRDLGIYGSDAILSDMTLLGVGNAAGSGGSSTLGRIGSGYMYADWVGQISYTSPNWNGFQFAVGAREPWSNGTSNTDRRSDMGFEGKVTYDFKTDDVAGRVWASAISQKHSTDTGAADGYTSRGWDLGAKVAAGNLGLVGYVYDGKGLSGPRNALSGLMFLGGNKTDDKGGYAQATYVIPTGTKLGASWGTSKTEDYNSSVEFENKSWIVGAYHPLTKSLNLVAEYTNQKLKTDNAEDGKAKTLSLGAILFF